MRINEFSKVEEREQDVFPMPDGELYIITKGTGEPVQVELNCPCGCGDLLILPVNNKGEAGRPGWGITYQDGKVTLNPSILQFRCGAHYFIRENKIIWC